MSVVLPAAADTVTEDEHSLNEQLPFGGRLTYSRSPEYCPFPLHKLRKFFGLYEPIAGVLRSLGENILVNRFKVRGAEPLQHIVFCGFRKIDMDELDKQKQANVLVSIFLGSSLGLG